MKGWWLPSLGYGLLGTALAGFGLALLLLPQRLAQRPMAQGLLTLHVGPGGVLRLWNQPVSRPELVALLRQARQRRPDLHLRLLPDPATPWGEVLGLLHQLDDGGLSLELQLPQG